jgi:hypothetical protein
MGSKLCRPNDFRKEDVDTFIFPRVSDETKFDKIDTRSLTFFTDISRSCIVLLSLMELSRNLRPLRLLDWVEETWLGLW